MELSSGIVDSNTSIKSYGDSGFTIIKNGKLETFSSSLIVGVNKHNDSVAIDWEIDNDSELTTDIFQKILVDLSDFELALIGMGNKFQPPSKDIKNLFKKQNIAMDFMDTGSACRSLNILLADGRKAVAFLKKIS